MLQVDEMIGLVEDFQRAWMPAHYIGMMHTNFGYPKDWPAEEKDAKVKELRTLFLEEKMPHFMGLFEGELKKHNGGQEGVGFLCGGSVTLADLYLLPQLRFFTKGVADHVPKDTLERFPVIGKYMERLYAVPQIKAWYKL